MNETHQTLIKSPPRRSKRRLDFHMVWFERKTSATILR